MFFSNKETEFPLFYLLKFFKEKSGN